MSQYGKIGNYCAPSGSVLGNIVLSPRDIILPAEPDLDALAEKLADKIYSRKVIIPCKYCRAANAYDNPTCVQCGGPLGA